MRIIDIIKMCFLNLWRRRVRTLLTVLGVVIGSCAIVVMISLGLASTASMEARLKQMGDLNVVTIYGRRDPSESSGGGGGAIMVSASSSRNTGMDDESLEAFHGIEGVTAVMPTLRMNDSQSMTFYGGKNKRYALEWPNVMGVDLSLMEKFGYKTKVGAIPATSPNENMLIVGSEVEYSFADIKKRRGQNTVSPTDRNGNPNEPFVKLPDDPIVVTVNNTKAEIYNDNLWLYPSGGRRYEHQMQVTAVLDPGESGGYSSSSYYSMQGVFMDIGQLKQLMEDASRLNGNSSYKFPGYDQIQLWVDDLEQVGNVQKAVEEMGYMADSMASIRDSQLENLRSQQLLLGGLAAVSLFVAAIGITNTMIMSIYERTREIGVMKVLGCFIGNIRQLFLMEAGSIGLLGGVMGVAISYVISFFLNRAGNGGASQGDFGSWMDPSVTANMPVSTIPLWLVLLALIFSTLIGLISGYYPANRAVKISALEAIKTGE